MAPRVAAQQAPFFTTRVASQVVDHQPVDSLSLRNWAQVRDDPRSRFKDKYGPTSRVAPGTQHQHKASTDAVANSHVEHYRLELEQARTEIQQLRGALHYAGLALQGVGSWDKLPPELRIHLDQHHRMVDELTTSLQERNEEVSKLREEGLQKEKLISHHRHVLLSSIGALSSDGPLLIAWSQWMKMMRQKHKENAFQAALAQSKGRMKPVILRTLKDLASGENETTMHVVFSKWLSVAKTQVGEALQKKQAADKIMVTMQMWAGKNSLLEVILVFKAWGEVLQAKAKQKLEELHVKQQVEVAKQARRGSIAFAAEALATSSDKTSVFMCLQLAFRAWREFATDSSNQRLLKEQQAEAKDYKNRMIERHCLLMLTGDVKAQFAWIFAGWRDCTQRQVIENILKLQTKVFHAWDRVTKYGHKARELAKIEAQLTKEDKEHLDTIKKQQTLRNRLLDLGQGENTLLLLHMVVSAWKETRSESKRELERESEREQWRLDFEQQQKKLVAEERARGMALAFSPELLLHVVWSAWVQLVLTEKRDKAMEGAQRVFEAHKLHEPQEREELKALMLEQHEALNSLMALGATSASNELMLRCSWSAWREIMYESKNQRLVDSLKESLKEKAPHIMHSLEEAIEEEIRPLDAYVHHQGPLHRCCWWCCPRCKPKAVPEESPYKKPGCLSRWLCCCCRSRHSMVKPMEAHSMEAHREQQHMWDAAKRKEYGPNATPEKKKANNAVNKDGSGMERIPLSNSASNVTAEQRHTWRCRAFILLSLQVFFTLVILGANVGAVVLGANGQGCDAFAIGDVPIPWLAIFIGNIAILFVALVLRFLWLMGGLLMCNVSLVKASKLFSEIEHPYPHLKSAGDQLANWHRELAEGKRQQDRGFTVMHVANCLFKLLVSFFFLWCAAGWLMFAKAEENCELQRVWWPALFGGMIGWASIIIILQCFQDPVIGA